jgi:hypothetical protein
LKAGACNFTPKEIILDDDQRIVGVKSTIYNLNRATHTDFFFILGKMAN